MPRPLSNKVPAWFGRKFDFTFPAEQYPNVCVRLRGTPAHLEEILRNLYFVAEHADHHLRSKMLEGKRYRPEA